MFNHTDDGVWGTGSYHDSKEDAIKEAKEYYLPEDYQTFYLGQIAPAEKAVYVDAERILEWIGEDFYEEMGESAEDYLRDVKQEHETILSERLSSVVNEWMREFGYEPNFFRIINVEKISNET
jgi:hypothetical protein